MFKKLHSTTQKHVLFNRSWFSLALSQTRRSEYRIFPFMYGITVCGQDLYIQCLVHEIWPHTMFFVFKNKCVNSLWKYSTVFLLLKDGYTRYLAFFDVIFSSMCFTESTLCCWFSSNLTENEMSIFFFVVCVFQSCGKDLSSHQLHYQCFPWGVHSHSVSTTTI